MVLLSLSLSTVLELCTHMPDQSVYTLGTQFSEG